MVRSTRAVIVFAITTLGSACATDDAAVDAGVAADAAAREPVLTPTTFSPPRQPHLATSCAWRLVTFTSMPTRMQATGGSLVFTAVNPVSTNDLLFDVSTARGPGRRIGLVPDSSTWLAGEDFVWIATSHWQLHRTGVTRVSRKPPFAVVGVAGTESELGLSSDYLYWVSADDATDAQHLMRQRRDEAFNRLETVADVPLWRNGREPVAVAGRYIYVAGWLDDLVPVGLIRPIVIAIDGAHPGSAPTIIWSGPTTAQSPDGEWHDGMYEMEHLFLDGGSLLATASVGPTDTLPRARPMWKINLATHASTQVLDAPESPELKVSSGGLYWTDEDGAIWRRDLSTSIEEQLVVTNTGHFTDFDLDGATLYTIVPDALDTMDDIVALDLTSCGPRQANPSR